MNSIHLTIASFLPLRRLLFLRVKVADRQFLVHLYSSWRGSHLEQAPAQDHADLAEDAH
jgi:hypothetical protein